MAKVTILGSAAAVPDENHENTYMLLQGDHSAVLIDCAGQPLVRLKRAGLPFDALTDVILTHFHPDHTYGFPILLMGMWLLGRQKPLRVYGLHHCLERTEDQMGFYHWEEWPNFFPIAFHRLPDRENMPVLDNSDFHITAWPVHHLIPTIGLRVEIKDSGKVLAYSSDTEPCPETVRLASGADILIHEAAGDDVGHSSAAQAGAIAAQAGAKRLILIHYRVWDTSQAENSALMEEARTTFDGPVELAQDFMEIEL
jgi:ribonuclease Z